MEEPMDEEQRKNNEHFAAINRGEVQPEKEVSSETKMLRIIALLILGTIVIYLVTAKIW
jgi:hypothetical protein